MARPIPITTFKGAGNIDSFNIVSESGNTINLDDFMGVLVTVEVCDETGQIWTIDSSNDDVNFDATVLYVKFGQLELPEGKYFPKIYFTHSTNSEPIVIVGKKARTEVLLYAQK